LAEAYSPFLEATARGILPEHLLGDVAPAEIPDDEFNLHPVGTGPFMVPQGENWRQTGRLHLAPNPAYWQQGIKLDNIEFRFYPNLDTLLEAYAAGEIQAINSVSPKVLPRVATLPGVRLYTAPQPRYTQLLFNLTEGGNPALREREVRQALAYALDREALIDGALHGQGIALQGPYLPSSWAYNPAALTLYPHRPISATTLLEEKGWALAEGAALRRQDGEDLTLRLLFLEQPLQRSVAETIASQWADAGVGVELVPVDEEVMTASLVGREFDVALTEVAPARDPDLYDFWSQEAIVKGQNYAGWSNRRASEALEQARQLWERAERQPYYDAFLRWFLLYRDVTVNCPDES
jgi:peptide/nickel transport system substrate-binding protein